MTPSSDSDDAHSKAPFEVQERGLQTAMPPFESQPIEPTRTTFKQRMQRATSQYLHTYTLCTVFASIGGFIFGFDTGSIGPVTVMPQFEAQFNSISATLQGLIVSSILITASISSIFAGHLSDRISRTRTFALGGLVFGVGSLIASTSYKLPQLFVGRCIAGVGEGLFLSTVTVYILEISPTNLRGRLSCLCQLLITTGIAAGYFVSYGSINLSSSVSWRLLFIMQAIVSFIFSAGSLFLPHSPRWLQHVGRTEDAARAWARLGFTATEAEKEQEVEERERDELTSEQEYARTGANVRDKRKGVTVTALFAKDVRKRTLLGVFLMGMQQACGIDGVLYYAPVLFSQAGLSSTTSAFLASGIAGILNIVCTIITQIFTDKWGRHSSMINGGLVISGTMIAIGSLYASQASTTTAGKWTIIALIYVFVVAYATSWAVVNRIYCSEIQPMHTRAAATSLGQCANWVVNWIIAFSTPLFLSRSSSGPYFLFGACALITVIVCILFQPESRGVSLEGLDKIFEVSPWRKVLRRIAPRMHGRRFGGGSVVSRGSASGGARDEAIGLTPIGA